MKYKLTWRGGTPLPFGITAPQHVTIGSALYVGGGQTDTNDSKRMVLCHCMDSVKWDILPPSPFMHFGLGQYLGKLITVGGSSEDDDSTVTGEVMHFNRKSMEWVRLIEPMPTARRRACVVSHMSCLAVCGGIERDGKVSCTVEVFREQQWQAASSLLKPRAAMGATVRDDTVYFTGGFYPGLKEWKYAQNDCQYINFSSLVENPSAEWKMLNALPVICTMVITHCGTLVAIGGLQASHPEFTNDKAVYAYSDRMSSWIQVDKLPFGCSSMMVASIYTNEIYIAGGWDEQCTAKRSQRVMIGAYNLI